ncbi:MAG: DUF523 and DUF1722 domain-containing protein [Lentisphaeria bacterium]|nr:DUF523 and DUF1722 domain-containing protein [Lentisphaeria bacterium]
MSKIRLGVSSCLLGNKVRYDGQHQRNNFVCDELAEFVEYVPVCPEVECGLPVPREAMHLTGDAQHPRLVTINTQRDITEQMQSFVTRRLEELALENLDGFIFKKDSPSSGLIRVKVYNGNGMPSRTGRGMFAGAFADRFPDLPLIEEGMLNDRFLRERFLNRISAAQRWRDYPRGNNPRRMLSEFQSENKLLLMSHAPGRYAELGRLVEHGDTTEYWRKFRELLQFTPSVSKHVNVMQHILGYFKKELEPWEKSEVLNAIDGYHHGSLQIAVPLTLLRHYVKKFDQGYLARQSYWNILSQLYL